MQNKNIPKKGYLTNRNKEESRKWDLFLAIVTKQGNNLQMYFIFLINWRNFFPWSQYSFYARIVWEVSFTTFSSTQAHCPPSLIQIWVDCLPRLTSSVIKAELLSLTRFLSIIAPHISWMIPPPRLWWWTAPGAAPCCWTWWSPSPGLAHTSGSYSGQCFR